MRVLRVLLFGIILRDQKPAAALLFKGRWYYPYTADRKFRGKGRRRVCGLPFGFAIYL